MIFEMTLDYHIVLPMILAVAAGLGVRRTLSSENIYTAKLVGRGHAIPKALHANMFLVRAAKDVMEKNFVIVPAEMRLDAFLRQPEHQDTGCQRGITAERHHPVGGEQQGCPDRGQRDQLAGLRGAQLIIPSSPNNPRGRNSSTTAIMT